jgi:hypothetical protein
VDVRIYYCWWLAGGHGASVWRDGHQDEAQSKYAK